MSTKERTASSKERLAYEAARIVLDQGIEDYDKAKRKAAERTGISDRRCWPSNEAIHEAVLTQRRLFLAASDPDALRRLRFAALRAMVQFEAYSPRLIGGALTGAIGPHAGVELQLFADRAEDVVFTLLDLGIPWRESERTLRFSRGERCSFPLFRFLAGEIGIDLIVLPRRAEREPPLDPVTDRPRRGADRREVERLMEEGNRDAEPGEPSSI